MFPINVYLIIYNTCVYYSIFAECINKLKDNIHVYVSICCFIRIRQLAISLFINLNINTSAKKYINLKNR